MTVTIDEHVGAALDRVRAIRWDQPDRNEREGSQISLMFELLRRMAVWAEALGCQDEWPFFSVAEQIAERSEGVRSILESPALQAARGELSGMLSYPRRVCSWFLQWGAIEDRDDVRDFGLPDPYEPALRIFERGGVFQIEQGMFQFFIASFPIGKISKYLSRPPLSLDEATLGGEDETWKREVERREAKR